MRIFSTQAPAYWARNLPVIPLKRMEKRPVPDGWSAWHDSMPDEYLREEWLTRYPEGNIGMVLGAQSGLMCVDMDTEDPRAQAIIRSVLPPTPWERVGRKGAVYGYRFNGEPTFRVKSETGQTLVEVLSTRTQVVLPPSIHPDTKMPYTSNTDLLEVYDRLPTLPKDWESTVRAALEDGGYTLSHSGHTKISEFIPMGARDNAMTSHAGILARAVTRGERTLVEAWGEMDEWCHSFVEKVDGDTIDSNKGKQQIVQFLSRDLTSSKNISLPKGWDRELTDELKKHFKLGFGEEHLEWDFERLKTYLVDEFTAHDRNSPQRMAAVNFVIERIARNQHLTILDEDRLLKWMADTSGLSMTHWVLRRRVRELRQGELTGENHHEIAEAVLDKIQAYGDIKFHNGNLWQWKGAQWEIMDQEGILKVIAEDYGELIAARRRNDHVGILKVIHSKATKKLRSLPDHGINFANGYLTIDGKLLDHHEAYGMTYTLPYRYLPELADKTFRFNDYLRSIWGDDEDFELKVQALREAIAATMFNVATTYKRVFVLYGAHASGKSELLKIVRGLMPMGTASGVKPSQWGDKFAPTQMHDKLINVCGELSEDQMIDGDKFKEIVEGEEIIGQYKGQQLFNFRPLCAHWFATNHLPKTRDSSPGFWRRWLFLTFNRTVGVEERVIDIGMKVLAEEREAIAAWAVAGMQNLIDRKELPLPASHESLVSEVANLNNSVRYFLTNSGKVSRKGSVSEADLHSVYTDFCIGLTGVRPVGERSFRSKCRELAPELGFKYTMKMNPVGTEYAVFENLGLVK